MILPILTSQHHFVFTRGRHIFAGFTGEMVIDSGKGLPIFRRFVVVGTSGAGKTTLSRAIASRIHIPHIELDALYHQPHWVPEQREVFIEKVLRSTAGGSWVVDGNYKAIQHILLPRADAVVWLDLPLGLILRRLCVRTAARLAHKTELWNGNKESLKELFAPDNLFSWAARHHGIYRARYLRLSEIPGCGHITLVRLRSPEEAAQWVEHL